MKERRKVEWKHVVTVSGKLSKAVEEVLKQRSIIQGVPRLLQFSAIAWEQLLESIASAQTRQSFFRLQRLKPLVNSVHSHGTTAYSVF